jgi:hypothetical protein
MKKMMVYKILSGLAAASLLLAGCKVKYEPTPVPPTDTPQPTPTITQTTVPPTVTPTSAPTPTVTPDLRLKPEDWQNWPIIPTLSPRAMEIYKTGLALGNDPKSFSKIGDCQSIKEAFMGLFDLKDRFVLTDDHKQFQETIDNFAGHFNTDSQGVKGGFNAAAVLSPMWANPDVCLPGENPLECEIRVTKPTFMFIRLEVWWDGRTAEQYEAYMRKIIEYAIAHGVVPVLATKADNLEGDNSLNLTTAKLAYEYDIPLWNFWRAVQPLPHHGMDPNRPDGFHVSYDAWNVASFGGLETLDTLWRQATGKQN